MARSHRTFSEGIETNSRFSVFQTDGSSSPSMRKLNVERSRRAVIEDMLKHDTDPVIVRNILLQEKKSDWTTSEIIRHMKNLGTPEYQLNRVKNIGRI